MLNNIEDPHCPNCRYGWTRQFVLQNITKTFLDHEWAAHRRQILWQREQAYLPDSQVHAERVLQSRRMAEELKPLMVQYREWQTRLEQLDRIINEKKPIICAFEEGKALERPFETTDPYEKLLMQETRQFTYHCPTPNCRGYLDKEFKCGLCRTTSSQSPPHSSRCTICDSHIYRGSTHCLQCKTPFNWTTGRSEKIMIESPYLFSYLTLHKPELLPNYIPALNTNTDTRIFDKIPDPLLYYTRSDRVKFETTLENLQAHSIRCGIWYVEMYILKDKYNKFRAPINTLRRQYLLNEIDESNMIDAIMNDPTISGYYGAISDISKTFMHVCLTILERCESAAIAAMRADASLAAFADTANMYLPEQFWHENTQSAWKLHKIWRNIWNNFYSEFTTLREFINNAFKEAASDFNIGKFLYIDEYYDIYYGYPNVSFLERLSPGLSKNAHRGRINAAKRVSRRWIPEGEGIGPIAGSGSNNQE